MEVYTFTVQRSRYVWALGKFKLYELRYAQDIYRGFILMFDKIIHAILFIQIFR